MLPNVTEAAGAAHNGGETDQHFVMGRFRFDVRSIRNFSEVKCLLCKTRQVAETELSNSFLLDRLTWWEYSWDIMEPVTYFVTYGTAMAAYAYYVLTKQVCTFISSLTRLLQIYISAFNKIYRLTKMHLHLILFLR